MITIRVAVLGLIALVTVALLLGLAAARVQKRARARITLQRQELDDWERELIRAAESRGCSACRLLRERAELNSDY